MPERVWGDVEKYILRIVQQKTHSPAFCIFFFIIVNKKHTKSGVKVKRRGKSSPHEWQHLWQCKPHLEQYHIEDECPAHINPRVDSRNNIAIYCLDR